uniref:Uncharacterized protein n=1 Tax=Corynebacterium phage HS01 TaxID=3056389 RepID=A0AA50AF65_9VIRU|nr:MAG: hypothetical protein [Corynebacterium phage HS01]
MLNRGRNESDSIAALLNRIIEGRIWRGYASETTGIQKEYPSFRQFVTDDLKIKKIDTLVGLVESVDTRVAENAKRLWLGETPTANGVGRPSGNGGVTTIKEKNDTNHILARLKRDHPDLAQQVIDGELTANAAARQLGWRKPRVLLTSPQQVAAKLRDHYSREDLAELARLICE